MSFSEEFARLQKHAYDNSASKGFHQADYDAQTEDQKMARFGLRIALIHSELSEALEAVRKNKTADDHIPEYSGAEAELADAVIRIMDLAETDNLRLGEAIIAKMAYNQTREFKHGGKKF